MGIRGLPSVYPHNLLIPSHVLTFYCWSAMDIFILAGQSNMAGRGNIAELPERYTLMDNQGGYIVRI